MRLSKLLHGGRTFPVVLFTLAALPYFLNLGVSSLWDANESFYAETPREMMESGNYLAPRFNYQIRAQKPPLTYWAIVLSYKVFGVSEFSARLPGALAALGVMLFTYGMGRVLFSHWAGLTASIILGTTFRFFLLARKLPIDILLLFFITGAGYLMVLLLHEPRERKPPWILLYLFLSLGFMTKGPVALIIPLGAWILHALWTRSGRWLPPHPVIGLVLCAGIICPWYVMVYREHGWAYIAPFFLRDNLARFATEAFGPPRGPLYYVTTYLSDFFPWSVLSLAAAGLVFVERASLRRRERSPYLFLLVWASTVLVLFSLSKNKQEYYIAPVYPFMALVIAGVLESSARAGRIGSLVAMRFWTWTFVSVAFLLAVAAFFILILAPDVFPDWSTVDRVAPAALLLIGSLGMAWRTIRSDLAGALGVLFFALWGLILAGTVYYVPKLEEMRPVKEMCSVIDREAAAPDQAGYFLVSVPSMVYYLRRPIFEEFDPDSMVARFKGDGRVFCILTEQDYNYFVGTRDLILYVLDRRPRLATQLRSALDEEARVRQELLLVSNRPWSHGELQGRLTP